MIPAAFRYHRAASLEDALDVLSETDAKALAGGQSLLPLMKLRVARPSVVVDLARLGLRSVARDDGDVRVGALATWSTIANAPELSTPGLQAIAECAAGIGDLQVRNLGTAGGSVAHADPASDFPAALLALGARLRLRSGDGEREVETADFFLGPFTTALAPAELIEEIVIPVPPSGSGSAYVSVEHPASGFALAGAAALVREDGSSRVAVTGVGPQPVLLAADRVPQAAVAELEVYGDRYAPEEYRRAVAAVVVRRALEEARRRAGGEAR